MGYVYYMTQDAARPQQMAKGVWLAGHILVAGSQEQAHDGNGVRCVIGGQVAARLGISEQAVWGLAQRGTLLPYCRMGKTLLYRIRDVEALAVQRGLVE